MNKMIELLDLFKDFFVSNTGSPVLAALLVILIAMILLMMLNVTKEALILIPLPIFLSLGAMANSTWLSVVAYILAGMYFATIMLSFSKYTNY